MTNSTRVAKTTNFISNCAKFIVLKVRKFRLLGWVYLIILFIWTTFSFLNHSQSNLPSSQAPNPLNNSNPVPPAPAPAPIPTVIEGSPSKAYKTGDQVTIRWDNPVFDTSFRVDNRRLRTDSFSCQLDFCTLNLSGSANIIQARWTENGEYFSKEFRLNN